MSVSAVTEKGHLTDVRGQGERKQRILMQAVHGKLKTGIRVFLKEAECADDLLTWLGFESHWPLRVFEEVSKAVHLRKKDMHIHDLYGSKFLWLPTVNKKGKGKVSWIPVVTFSISCLRYSTNDCLKLPTWRKFSSSIMHVLEIELMASDTVGCAILLNPLNLFSNHDSRQTSLPYVTVFWICVTEMRKITYKVGE